VGFDPFGPGIDGISCRREGRSIRFRAPEILPIGPPGAPQFHSVAPGFRFPAIFSSGYSQFPVSERFGASGAEFRTVYALGVGRYIVQPYIIMTAPRPAVKPARGRWAVVFGGFFLTMSDTRFSRTRNTFGLLLLRTFRS
jgi:hypothetical protein